jgi:hypothetical protein
MNTNACFTEGEINKIKFNKIYNSILKLRMISRVTVKIRIFSYLLWKTTKPQQMKIGSETQR